MDAEADLIVLNSSQKLKEYIQLQSNNAEISFQNCLLLDLDLNGKEFTVPFSKSKLHPEISLDKCNLKGARLWGCKLPTGSK
jgi:hypothetical protein